MRYYILFLLLLAGCQPAISVDLKINGDTANTPPGPEINVGAKYKLQCYVDNTGQTAVSDINHTIELDPGTAPIQLTLKEGDKDKDYILDLDETWLFEGEETSKPGEHRTIATVTGRGVEDTDILHRKRSNNCINIWS